MRFIKINHDFCETYIHMYVRTYMCTAFLDLMIAFQLNVFGTFNSIVLRV